MKTIGIISEYNPLHEGHIYHINEIRKEFGNESAIIALMSGNYVQRGDVSIGDKYFRAKMAIDNGIDLVLEFPFPFCCENATIFANKAIEILTKLKIVDVISFGSECGDITLLKNIAEKINNRINEFDILLSTKHSSNGFPHDFFEKTKEFLSNEEYCAFFRTK